MYIHADTLDDYISSDVSNAGEINIGAGNHYLFAVYDKFNKIYGFNLCSYAQYYDKWDHRVCHPSNLDGGRLYSLSPFSPTLATCGDEL